MKKSLTVGIILAFFSISLIIYTEFIQAPINIHEITNSGSKDVNTKVYLDATFVAGTITYDDDRSYYVIFGDGVQYIVYMDNELANKINKYLLDNPDNSYIINGYTKLIPTSMEENGKKFVKEWLDHSHNHEQTEENHSHEITTDEFYHYFGYVYLDNTNDKFLMKIIIYVSGIVGILLILNYANNKYHFM